MIANKHLRNLKISYNAQEDFKRRFYEVAANCENIYLAIRSILLAGNFERVSTNRGESSAIVNGCFTALVVKKKDLLIVKTIIRNHK